MARRKKDDDPIIGLGRNEEKLIVQKSLPLFSLWKSDLTLSEFKILDIYLSRINSRDPDRRAILLEKGEIEKILGVKKINAADLKERLKHLMGNIVEVRDPDAKKGFQLVTLFEEATAEQDDYGIWQIRLECTQKAMRYFFNIENLGYLRYKLRCITSIKSRYSYILFIYLESNRFRGSWEVGIDELREILHCDDEKVYKEYKYFNAKILKRIQKELHEKTECKYEYEPIKKGRSVAAIRFKLNTLPKAILSDPDPIPEIENMENNDIDQDMNREYWEDALQEFNFSREKLDEIGVYLRTLPDNILPDPDSSYGNIQNRRYLYMLQKVAELKRRDSTKPIRDKFAYLLKMIKKDGGAE